MDDMNWLYENKDWIWWALGIVLLIGEMLLPGAFMMWIGFAALVTGVMVFLVDSLSFEIQGLVFAVLSIVSVYVGRKVIKANPTISDNEMLNKRGERYVGKHYVLVKAIENGVGRVSIGDSNWSVEGPDLPEGTRVEVVSVNGAVMTVKAIEG